MKKCLLLCFLFSFLYIRGNTQDTSNIKISKKNEPIEIADTAKWVDKEPMKLDANLLNIKPKFKPNPKKAVIYSAIFPGLGQIYNRKYWKLPLIYGGFIGISYGITWNGQYYGDYKDAFSAISSDDFRSDANFSKWKDMAPQSMRNQDISDANAEWLKGQFKRKKNVYRRNRDLCIIGAVGIYALCMIDAYVDAHLFDFDISPDLSLRVEPTVMSPTAATNKSIGVQCSVKF